MPVKCRHAAALGRKAAGKRKTMSEAAVKQRRAAVVERWRKHRDALSKADQMQ